MKKENFNLKLKIFFLEERLALGDQNKNASLLADNIDLKVQYMGRFQQYFNNKSMDLIKGFLKTE